MQRSLRKMRTYDFKKYKEFSHGNFLPIQTIESEEFGRHFFIDTSFDFISAPSFKNGGYDKNQLDYVCNWTDLEGVNLESLFNINRQLCWNQWQEDKDKAHSDMCEYMEAVESGEIAFL